MSEQLPLEPPRRKNSRRKGAVAEREIAHILTEAGFPARRDGHVFGDLTHQIPDTHIEVKRSERPRIADWIAQARKDAAMYGIRTWAVVWRGNRQPWTVSIPLEEWLRLRTLEATAFVEPREQPYDWNEAGDGLA